MAEHRTKESGIARLNELENAYGDWTRDDVLWILGFARALVAERDALLEALRKADRQLAAAPVLDAYSVGAWQTIRAALERPDA